MQTSLWRVVYVYMCACLCLFFPFAYSLIDTEKCEMSTLLCKVLTIYPFKFGTGIFLMRSDISVMNSKSLFNLKILELSSTKPSLPPHSIHHPRLSVLPSSIIFKPMVCDPFSLPVPWFGPSWSTAYSLPSHYSFNWIPCLWLPPSPTQSPLCHSDFVIPGLKILQWIPAAYCRPSQPVCCVTQWGIRSAGILGL